MMEIYIVYTKLTFPAREIVKTKHTYTDTHTFLKIELKCFITRGRISYSAFRYKDELTLIKH